MVKFINASSRYALLLTLLACSSAFAQSMREVETSSALNKLKDLPRRSINDGINKKSNFAKIFKASGGSQFIFTWLGDQFPGFNKGRIQTHDSDALVEVKKKFEISETKQGKHAETVDVTVYIPRPWMENGAEYGIFPAIRALEPPALLIDQQESLRINGYKVQLYVHKGSRTCSMVLHLSRFSVMNLYVENCAYNVKMIELLEQFDIDRLNQKLET